MGTYTGPQPNIKIKNGDVAHKIDRLLAGLDQGDSIGLYEIKNGKSKKLFTFSSKDKKAAEDQVKALSKKYPDSKFELKILKQGQK